MRHNSFYDDDDDNKDNYPDEENDEYQMDSHRYPIIFNI